MAASLIVVFLMDRRHGRVRLIEGSADILGLEVVIVILVGVSIEEVREGFFFIVLVRLLRYLEDLPDCLLVVLGDEGEGGVLDEGDEEDLSDPGFLHIVVAVGSVSPEHLYQMVLDHLDGSLEGMLVGALDVDAQGLLFFAVVVLQNARVLLAVLPSDQELHLDFLSVLSNQAVLDLIQVDPMSTNDLRGEVVVLMVVILAFLRLIGVSLLLLLSLRVLISLQEDHALVGTVLVVFPLKDLADEDVVLTHELLVSISYVVISLQLALLDLVVLESSIGLEGQRTLGIMQISIFELTLDLLLFPLKDSLSFLEIVLVRGCVHEVVVGRAEHGEETL
jgi:hypothetical protein